MTKNVGGIGLMPLATGFMGWCPTYAMLGFNTCSVKKWVQRR
jgi:hypothetical protein